MLKTDVVGASAGSKIYHVFGATRSESPIYAILRSGFTDQYEDETGLNYYKKRYYNSEIGRFVSADRLYEEEMDQRGVSSQELNLFAYVKNDPLNNVDPSGENTRLVQLGVHSVVEVWNPNSPNKITSIEMGPKGGFNLNTLGNIAKSALTMSGMKGEVRITPGEPPFTFSVPGSETILSPAQDQLVIDRARALQGMYAAGELKFNPMGFSLQGDATNCIGFSYDLMDFANSLGNSEISNANGDLGLGGDLTSPTGAGSEPVTMPIIDVPY